MSVLIDDVSRILAAPMSRLQKVRLIRSTVTARHFSGLLRYAEVEARKVMRPLRGRQRQTRLDVAETAARLRLAYLARDSHAYRTEVFAALLRLRRADGPELERVVEELLDDVHKYGADGIETLVLTGADGVAIHGDNKTKKSVRALLASSVDTFKYWSALPPPNLRIPLGRVSSHLVLDVRPDAIGVLVDQLTQMSQASQELQSMMELIDARQTRDALCELPPLPNQSGETSAVDTARLENCGAADGSSGSSGDSTVERALGRLLSGGCNLMTDDEVATWVARIEAMDDCFEQRNGGRPLPTEGATTKAKVGKVAWEIVKAILEEVAGGEIGEEIDKPAEARTEHEKAVNEAALQERLADNATEYRQEIEGLRNAAQKMLDIAKETLRDAQNAARDPQATDAERNAAKNAVRQAEDQVKRWQSDLDKRNEELREATKEEQDAKAREKAARGEAERTNPDKELSPDDPFNDACKEVMGDLDERAISERLGKDWTKWNETRGQLPHVWDPAPDDLQPYDALRLPFCGSDEVTLSNLPEKCSIPVDCFEGTPDESCRCEGTPTDEARLVASIAVNACSEHRCQDGTTGGVGQGLVCVCGQQPSEGYLKLPRPTPTVIAALFEKGNAAPPEENFTTFGLVRSLYQDLSSSRDHS